MALYGSPQASYCTTAAAVRAVLATHWPRHFIRSCTASLLTGNVCACDACDRALWTMTFQPLPGSANPSVCTIAAPSGVAEAGLAFHYKTLQEDIVASALLQG